MSHFEHETMKLVMANIETDTTLKLMLAPSFTLGLLAHAPFVSQPGSTCDMIIVEKWRRW